MSSTGANPDLCVIGASEAGLAAAMGAIALGLSCLLVDDGDPSGLRNPDLMLASLCHAAADPARHASAWSEMRQALARAAPERRHARFAAMNVRLLRGAGRFVDAATLVVDDQAVRARRFLIATGGRQPSRSLVDPLQAGLRLSLADLAGLDEAPADVLVVGGGSEAVSVAQSLARLGGRVTLATDALLPGFDPELAAPLRAQMRRDGVTLVSANVRDLSAIGGRVLAVLSDGTTIATGTVLLAEDRRPALSTLDPVRAGLMLEDGSLKLDGALRTNKRHILAIGRAAGARSTAEGIGQAGVALRAAFLHLPGAVRAEIVPTVTATWPQLATVGRLHPSAAGERVWRWPLAHTGGGALAGIDSGQIKIRTDRGGRIVGAGLVGVAVRELIPFWTLAVARGLTLAEVAEALPPIPSLSESFRALATQDLGRRLASPWVRRALRVARWIG